MLEDADWWERHMSVPALLGTYVGIILLTVHFTMVFGVRGGDPYRTWMRCWRDTILGVPVSFGFKEVPTMTNRETRAQKRIRIGSRAYIPMPEGGVSRLHFVEVSEKYVIRFPGQAFWREEGSREGITRYQYPQVASADDRDLHLDMVVMRRGHRESSST